MPESQYSIVSAISVGQMTPSFATWNSSTALNTTALLVNNDISFNTLNVSLSQTTTITGGVVTFQGSYDGTNYFNVTGWTPGTSTTVGPTYTLQANTYASFQFNLTAIPYFQILLSTAITGTGAVTIGFAADSFVGSNSFVTGTVAVTQSTTPWVDNITQWASTALGTPQTFGTAPTGVVIGTSSDLYIAGTRGRSNQTTTAAGVLDNNLVGVAGTTVVTAAAGVQKVGIVGNAAGVLDAVTGAAVPANAIQVGASDGANLQPLSINVKGTQGARGLAVQELKDSGRTYVTFFYDNVAGVTTEALMSGATNKGNTVTAAQTSYTVTAGKTLRIQSISVAVINTTSLAQQFKLRLRQAASGISATSNIVWGTIFGSSTGSNAAISPTCFDFPDGLEIAGGQQIAFSMINLISTAGGITVTMTGFEY